MASFASHISFALLFLLFATTFNKSVVTSNKVIRCNENDQRLLLLFKQGVVDPNNQLSSWTVEQDCCLWEGVHCNNITGRVTELSLSNHTLEGEINVCALQLEFLSHLDLSHNHFGTVSIPPCQNSKSPFDAHKFDNQSLATPSNQSSSFSVSLSYLDFSYNGLAINDSYWLSQLSSLKYLDLSFNDIGNDAKWLQHLAMLPSLCELHLSFCFLSSFPSLDYINFTSLEVLDLSFNYINSIPNSFFNITSHIYHLDLLGCDFYGQLPKALHNLQNLRHLNLSLNKLEGSIPDWICQHEQLRYFEIRENLFNGSIPSCLGNLSSLISLDLSNNHFIGNLPESLGKLHNLESLNIAGNSLAGVLSEKNLANLLSLTSLDLSSSGFKFDFDPNWVPLFQLQVFNSRNTSLGPNFPPWLYTQRSLEYLDISISGISTFDVNIFWSFIARIDEVDLSNNLISGDISNVTLYSSSVYLNYNNLTGGLPRISANAVYFGASHNSLSGSIFLLLCPREINRENMLSYLDISYNHFTGALPDCWASWKQLKHIDLGSNKLYGKVPPSMALLTNLGYLNLGDNGFFGNFSLDLSRWTNLEYLVLDRNKFIGNLPSTMQQKMMVFKVRANQFVGNIPTQLCNVSSLRIIDLADNKLSGSIPQCLYSIAEPFTISSWGEETNLFTKGRQFHYRVDVLYSTCSIDFSSNNLSGDIPKKLFTMTQLWSLNLSRNHLTGKIPKEIGDVKNLESLDLSYNKLYGEIPSTISTISFLAYLNLSYNNFVGQIPLGTQIQSFDSWSFVGNSQLCGDPLPIKCNKKEETHSKLVEGNEDNSFMKSLYLGMGVGFTAGFWEVCSSLFLIKAWRHRFLRLFDYWVDQLYVSVALKLKVSIEYLEQIKLLLR